MRVVVITGGIGAGKSTAAAFLRDKGAVVIDADRVAAEVLSKGSPSLASVVEAFGPDVLLADGSLDRAALASVAFVSAERANRLNAIVHPVVEREMGAAVGGLLLSEDAPALVVLDVPLLAEAPSIARFADYVIAIVAPQELRIARAVIGGIPEAEARRRMAVQATDAARAALADSVIINDGPMDRFAEHLERAWSDLVGEAR